MAQSEVFDAETPVIAAARGGDRYAFTELMRRHNGWVRGVIYGVLGDRDAVDDVAQQAWMTVWLRIGELRDAERWRSWMYRLVRNAAVDAGRESTRRRARMYPGPTDAAADRGSAPDRNMSGWEKREAILEAIRGLPALYREPFVLRHLNGWSYAKIADLMDMPVDSVETRLVRARRLLRESLTDLVSKESPS